MIHTLVYQKHLTEVQCTPRFCQNQSVPQAGLRVPQKREIRNGARRTPVHTQRTINRNCRRKRSTGRFELAAALDCTNSPKTVSAL